MKQPLEARRAKLHARRKARQEATEKPAEPKLDYLTASQKDVPTGKEVARFPMPKNGKIGSVLVAVGKPDPDLKAVGLTLWKRSKDGLTSKLMSGKAPGEVRFKNVGWGVRRGDEITVGIEGDKAAQFEYVTVQVQLVTRGELDESNLLE